MERRRIEMLGAGAPIDVIRFTPAHPVAVLVLLHGWGETAESLVGLAEAFAGAGFDTAAMSMRGWGRSGGADDCGLHQPDDVAAIAEQLRASRDDSKMPVFSCGMSQGGQVALLAAARQPSSFDAVVAWAPVTDVGRWRETTTNGRIVDYIDATCADGDLDVRSPVAQAHNLTMPILLVHGDADSRVPIEQSRVLQHAIETKSGHCDLEVLAGIGHGGPEARARCVAATTTFLESVDPRTTR